jgi:hypothetical protein
MVDGRCHPHGFRISRHAEKVGSPYREIIVDRSDIGDERMPAFVLDLQKRLKAAAGL